MPVFWKWLAVDRKALISFFLFLLLAGLLGAGYWLGPKLAPKGEQVLPVAACDLNLGPCTVELPGGGRLRVEIGPRPIPVLKPLDVRVAFEGFQAEKVLLDFSGVEMDMGFNQVSLKPLGEGRFAGRGNLPVCVTGAMVWQATFMIEGRAGRFGVPFRFITGH